MNRMPVKYTNAPFPGWAVSLFSPVIVFTMCTFTAVRILGGQPLMEILNVKTIYELLFLISGLTLLYIVGIADDLVGVRYRKKILGANSFGGGVPSYPDFT